MDYPSWLPIGAALIGGGAAGAVITAVVTSYRNRTQPVAYRVSTREMFRRNATQNRTVVQVSISEDGQKHEYDNLHEVVIDLFNSGNSDRATFDFGITLRAGQEVIFTELTTKDRHHQFSKTPFVKPGDGRNELDFRVEPFNRRDTYSLRLYVISNDGHFATEDVELSSPAPVKFNSIASINSFFLAVLKASTVFPGGYVGNFTADLLARERLRHP